VHRSFGQQREDRRPDVAATGPAAAATSPVVAAAAVMDVTGMTRPVVAA
jgi:hypothetical protein